jgi:hypothetical protein
MNKKYLNKIRENYFIECTTQQEKSAVLNILIAAGEKIVGGVSIDNPNIRYPKVGFYYEDEWNCFTKDNNNRNSVSFYEFVSNLHSGPILLEVNIPLNEEYSANYKQGNDFITVGCQKIPLLNFDELTNAINTIREKAFKH